MASQWELLFTHIPLSLKISFSAICWRGMGCRGLRRITIFLVYPVDKPIMHFLFYHQVRFTEGKHMDQQQEVNKIDQQGCYRCFIVIYIGYKPKCEPKQ